MKFFISTLVVALNVSCYFHCCQSLAFGFANKMRLDSNLNSVSGCDSLQQPPKDDFAAPIARRELLLRGVAGATVLSTALTAAPNAAMARYVLDEATGDYVELEEDADWQTAWKQRLDKASSMSQDEIFKAARGAGNLDLRTGPESDASKKRRAMSACRDAGVRSKAGAGTEKDCTARVFSGEVDFLLVDAL
jgi:hypothetical protein